MLIDSSYQNTQIQHKMSLFTRAMIGFNYLTLSFFCRNFAESESRASRS